MGTTNRAFSQTLVKAQMLHQVKGGSNRNHMKRKNEAVKGKRSFSIKDTVKRVIDTVFRFFGFGGKRWTFPLADFTTPTHSPHLCGRRTEEQRQQRKARRQKRTMLKMKRGYA